MKVFIINMKRSTARRTNIEKECMTYKLEYEFIDAVDGRLLSPPEIKQHTRELNYAYRPGEIGCALSHIEAYRLMCARGIDSALILEDDAKLMPEIVDVLTELDKVGSSEKPTITLLTETFQYQDKCLSQLDLKHSIFPVIEACMSHGYVINRPAAKNALMALYPVWMVADRWNLFNEYSICDVNAVIPPVIVHSDLASESTISTPSDHQTQPFLKNEIWEKLRKKRPFAVRLKRMVWLTCKRKFIKIIKN
ncbi:glycosyltransferase family 25 protein [Biostraticola tofi]|uniref:Glycosyl transferase family 25 n=1 Tax=Biostraticola tofi TaxID=466109 RepID=A0A4R3Z538_9GAMM|nr:glycosyltransferase family 25 protein [Biostraticola tofi]TCW00448.1 glycosyl transferase family 25 [Biostraticola tofi]